MTDWKEIIEERGHIPTMIPSPMDKCWRPWKEGDNQPIDSGFKCPECEDILKVWLLQDTESFAVMFEPFALQYLCIKCGYSLRRCFGVALLNVLSLDDKEAKMSPTEYLLKKIQDNDNRVGELIRDEVDKEVVQ